MELIDWSVEGCDANDMDESKFFLYEGKCYFIPVTGGDDRFGYPSHEESDETCKANGGVLTSITSPEMTKELALFARRNNAANPTNPVYAIAGDYDPITNTVKYGDGDAEEVTFTWDSFNPKPETENTFLSLFIYPGSDYNIWPDGVRNVNAGYSYQPKSLCVRT